MVLLVCGTLHTTILSSVTEAGKGFYTVPDGSKHDLSVIFHDKCNSLQQYEMFVFPKKRKKLKKIRKK